MIEVQQRVIYGDTDQMGVVYYANYLRFFERGRTELLRAHGGDYRDLERDGFMLPVVQVTCRYRAPARFDDLLSIRTRVAELERVRLTFAYEIFREGEVRLLCEGATVHACMGRDGKPTRLPAKVLERLNTPSATEA